MRPLDLFLAGQRADLPASTKGLAKFSQARAALSDVAARVGEFSLPLTLPATRANQAIFGVQRLHAQGVNKFGYYTDLPYELRVGGQVFAGVFRLTSLKNGYTGSLIGEGLSWALLLGDKKLPDLRFAPIDYDGSQLNDTLSLDCDATDVQFPLIAWGNFFHPPTTTIDAEGKTQEVPSPPAAVLDYALAVDDYPPGVYYVNVLRQIFRSIGWQLQGRELDSDFWRAVVHTCAGADLSNAWPWAAILRFLASGVGAASFSRYNDAAGDYGNTAAGFDQNQNGEVFYLPLVAPLQRSPTRAYDAPTASYTAPKSGLYGFHWQATLAAGSQSWREGGAFITAALRNYFQPVGLGLVVRRGGADFTGCDGGLCTGPLTGSVPIYGATQTSVLSAYRLDTGGTGLKVGQAFTDIVQVYLEAGDTVTLAAFARRRLVSDQGNVQLIRQAFSLTWTGVQFGCGTYVDDAGVSEVQLHPERFLPPLACKDVVKDFLYRIDGFLLADSSRKVATILTRAELTQAGGEALDLSGLCDPRATEFLPAAGAGVGSLVFAPASNDAEPLLPLGYDQVTAIVGPGDSSQQVSSLYAPVGVRTTYFLTGKPHPLPTCATAELLKQNRSEVAWDIGSQPPRLVRYFGPDGYDVPYLQSSVPWARAAWDGPLAWDGASGAVGTYYQSTIRRALTGHLARVSVPLSPALYRGMQPGRRVLLHGAGYTVEAVSQWDAADEGALCSVDLSREV